MNSLPEYSGVFSLSGKKRHSPRQNWTLAGFFGKLAGFRVILAGLHSGSAVDDP